MRPLEPSYEEIDLREPKPHHQPPLATDPELVAANSSEDPDFYDSPRRPPDGSAPSEPSDAWVQASNQPWADTRTRRRLPRSANVLVSVASLLSVLLFLLGLSVALQAFLLRKLQPDWAAETDADQQRTRLQRQAIKVIACNCLHPRVFFDEKEELGAALTTTSRSSEPGPPSFPLLPREAYLSGRRLFCVFNADRWTDGSRLRRRTGRGGLAYGIETFPYHLCTDAVYCCAAMGTEGGALKVDTFMPLRFAALRLKNPQLRLWLSVGGSVERSTGFSRAALDDEANREFVRCAVDWLQEFGYQGLLLHWTFPEAHEKHFLVALDMTGQSLGAVLPLDDTLRSRFDTEAVTELLDQRSVLIIPEETRDRSFNRTFLPYSKEVLEQYARASLDLGSSHESCYLVSLSGTSLALRNSDHWDVGDAAEGPGVIGGARLGQVAFDDICVRHWIGSKWVGYLTEDTLRDFLSDVAISTGSRGCLGVADPEWDDFSGVCQPDSPYPLTKVVSDAALTIKWVGYLTEDTLRDFLSDVAISTGSRGCLGVADPEWDDFSGVCQPDSPYPLTRIVSDAALTIKGLRTSFEAESLTSKTSTSEQTATTASTGKEESHLEPI
ncbi:hypothetical protein IscW_ISCW002760 [Ixodes scapularis]|uniref:GH18 domain-containing protein n=1 Tax=Ixodes scapularis TaxID=6945 RepID=B7P8V0_IXOSC|nr:hypothetical protein IscW_ISCW002760 [Ixodes scapularis]|eukprot:XP_002403120.1 hypothetical protein IscW_ISCW002760 [Ixodes scapularis]